MKHHLIFASLLLLLCTSCNGRFAIRKTLREFQTAVINLPSEMIAIENGKISVTEVPQAGCTFVEYYSPEVCTGCVISHISDNEPLYELGEELSFNVVIILSPGDDDLEMVFEKLESQHFHHPVYIDSDQSFLTENIPQDHRFHSFLLDPDGHPVIVGNPATSERIEGIFRMYMTNPQK